ncbi:MAG: O-antigen ligase family protein [Enterococcus sp.]
MSIIFILMGFLFFKGTFFLLNIPLFWIDAFTLFLVPIIIIKKRIIFNDIVLVLLCLFFQNLLLTFGNVNSSAFQGLKNISIMFLLYIGLTLFINDTPFFKKINYFLVFLFTFCGLSLFLIVNIVLKNRLFSTTSIYMYKGLFVLPYGESNYVASFFLFLGLLLLTLLFNKKAFDLSQQPYWYKLIFCIFLIICPIVILILNSRSSIVAYTIILMLLLFKKFLHNKRKTFIISVLIISAVLLTNRYTNFIELVSNRFSGETTNVGARINQYTEVIELIKNESTIKLLLGNGFGTDKFKFGILIHNFFLKIIYSFGIIGLIPQLYIYIKMFFISNKLFSIPLLGLLIVSMVEPVLFTGMIDYLIIISLAMFTHSSDLNQKVNKIIE